MDNPPEEIGRRRSFQITSPVPPGAWPISTTSKSLTMMRLQKVVVREPGQGVEVAILVHEEPFVSGTVVDRHGKPVAGLMLMLSGYNTSVSTRSHQDGWFRFYRPLGGAEKLTLSIGDPANGEPLLSMPCTLGTHDLEIKLKRSPVLQVTMVDDTGRPVERFAIKCYAQALKNTNSSSMAARMHGSHRGGRVTLDRLARGWNTLIVIPDEPSLGVVETSFEVKDSDPGPKRVELPRLAPMKVHVRDKHGNPVAGAWVQVIDPCDNIIRLETRVTVVDHRDFRRTLWTSPGAPRPATVVSAAMTNAGGLCVVYGLRGQGNLVIRVSIGERHRYLEHDVEFGKDDVVRKIEVND